MKNSKSQQTIIQNGLESTGHMRWEDIKPYILPCLVPVVWNNMEAEMDGQLASSDFLDLSVYYYIRLSEENDKNFQTIAWMNDTVQKEWEISMQTVEEQARKNIKKDGYSIRSMEEILQIAFADEQASGAAAGVSLYVLTNQRAFFGAAGILDNEILSAFAEKIEQNLYIIPSSIHEILICPDSGQIETEELDQMIKEVNETQVDICDRLSEHVYYYDRDRDEIRTSK